MFFCPLFCLYFFWVSFSVLISVFHVGIFLEFFECRVMRYCENEPQKHEWQLCTGEPRRDALEANWVFQQGDLCVARVSTSVAVLLFSSPISPKNLWSPCVHWRWSEEDGPSLADVLEMSQEAGTGGGLPCLSIQSTDFHSMPLLSTWFLSFHCTLTSVLKAWDQTSGPWRREEGLSPGSKRKGI